MLDSCVKSVRYLMNKKPLYLFWLFVFVNKTITVNFFTLRKDENT